MGNYSLLFKLLYVIVSSFNGINKSDFFVLGVVLIGRGMMVCIFVVMVTGVRVSFFKI